MKTYVVAFYKGTREIETLYLKADGYNVHLSQGGNIISFYKRGAENFPVASFNSFYSVMETTDVETA
jgi:hypothetical protein